MVRLVKLWIGLHPLSHAQAPPWPRRQQMHMVRLHIQRLWLPPQPHGKAREIAFKQQHFTEDRVATRA